MGIETQTRLEIASALDEGRSRRPRTMGIETSTKIQLRFLLSTWRSRRPRTMGIETPSALTIEAAYCAGRSRRPRTMGIETLTAKAKSLLARCVGEVGGPERWGLRRDRHAREEAIPFAAKSEAPNDGD